MTGAGADPAQVLRAAFAPGSPKGLGVAVSGGGDSMALLHLLAEWRAQGGPDLAVATVDHGLRPEAASEAAMVARTSAGLGIPHDTLHWQWDGTGNLSDRARRARLSLIGDWARGRGLSNIALGHTPDDQAETFLMRLARGSGPDGLSGMALRRTTGDLTWWRPLLGVSRAALRDWLTARSLTWADDPSNEDRVYDRVRMRQAAPMLTALGLDAATLAETATRMAEARVVLDAAADALAAIALTTDMGDALLDAAALAQAPVDTRLRLFSRALLWIAPADYRPRRAQAEAALAAALSGAKTTLAGALILGGAQIRLTREPAAVAQITAEPGALWDHRWRIDGPAVPGTEIRSLGEAGLAQLPDWRAAGRPRAAVLGDPGVWRGPRLVAAPTLGRHPDWRVSVAKP